MFFSNLIDAYYNPCVFVVIENMTCWRYWFNAIMTWQDGTIAACCQWIGNIPEVASPALFAILIDNEFFPLQCKSYHFILCIAPKLCLWLVSSVCLVCVLRLNRSSPGSAVLGFISLCCHEKEKEPCSQLYLFCCSWLLLLQWKQKSVAVKQTLCRQAECGPGATKLSWLK